MAYSKEDISRAMSAVKTNIGMVGIVVIAIVILILIIIILLILLINFSK